MDDSKEKAIAFYTVLIFGLGVIVTIDTAYQLSAFTMLVQGLFFAVVMYVAIKMPLLMSIFRKLEITQKPKINHWFKLSKDNQ